MYKTTSSAIQLFEFGNIDFTKIIEQLSNFEYPVQNFINDAIFIAPNYNIFSINRSSTISICYGFKTATLFGKTFDTSFMSELIEISKNFSNIPDRNIRKQLFSEFQEKKKSIDMSKWKEFTNFITKLYEPSASRMKNCLDNIAKYINTYNIQDSNKLFCFYGTLSSDLEIDSKEITIDLYEDYFGLESHMYAMFYYPNTNTFYLIDPDTNDDKYITIYEKFLQALCKRFDFKPNYRVISGEKVQELT